MRSYRAAKFKHSMNPDSRASILAEWLAATATAASHEAVLSNNVFYSTVKVAPR